MSLSHSDSVDEYNSSTLRYNVLVWAFTRLDMDVKIQADWFDDNRHDRSETFNGVQALSGNWQELWEAGRMAGRCGNAAKQEELLRLALWQGQYEEGLNGAELGVLLFDLAECLEHQGKAEANDFHKQARDIVISNLCRFDKSIWTEE